VLVNRGFAGEQIKSAVKRFNADVVELNPKVVVLFEGTNDISVLYAKIKDENLTDQQIYEEVKKISFNHEKIIRFAISGGIKLIVCSILPYGCLDKRSEMIIMLNKMIKELCEKYSLPFADFHSALVNDDGLTLKPVHFGDELHPHVLGYNEMAKVLYPHLDKAIFNKRK
jgi:lysophospholipase L1-like esterase